MNKIFYFCSLLVLVGLILVIPNNCSASHHYIKIDSLRTAINSKKGTEKISARLNLAEEIIKTDKKEAFALASSALKDAKNNGNQSLEMQSYFLLGKVYFEEGDNKLSLVFLDSALQITTKIEDEWYLGEILYNIGLIKHRMGDYLNALETFNKAVQACRQTDNFKTAGSVYSMMGNLFRMNGLYDRAIEYIIKAKLNFEKARFNDGIGWTTYLLGRIYFDVKLPEEAHQYFQEALEVYSRQAAYDGNKGGLAICYEQIGILNIEEGNLEEARKNIDNALKIYFELDSKYGMSNVYKYLGILENLSGNFKQAETYLNQAYQINLEVDDKLSRPGIYLNLGLNMIETGRKKEGLELIYKGLDVAVSNNQKKIQLNIYSKLAEVYLKQKDFSKVIECQNKQIEIQNFIQSGAANIKTEQLQTIYEIEEKNAQIEVLEKQNKINVLTIKQQRIIRNFMIAGILLVILITLTIFWFYRQLQKKNRELHENNAAKDKFFTIIAHDLRGPTSALAALLEHIHSSFDEIDLAELKKIMSTLYKSADNVSSLLENLLIWAQSQVDKITLKPIEFKLTDGLRNAVGGLSHSAENKQIDIKLEGDNDLRVFADFDTVQTIVRNILSNAIKFTYRGGVINVNWKLNGSNQVIVGIQDNGVGIEASILPKIFDIDQNHHTQGTEKEMSTGLGLILVKDFVEKNKGTLTIESEVGKGTVVSFTLPAAPKKKS